MDGRSIPFKKLVRKVKKGTLLETLEERQGRILKPKNFFQKGGKGTDPCPIFKGRKGNYINQREEKKGGCQRADQNGPSGEI